MIVFLYFEEKKRPLVFHRVENQRWKATKKGVSAQIPPPPAGQGDKQMLRESFSGSGFPGADFVLQ